MHFQTIEIDFFMHHWTQCVCNYGKPLDLLSISKVDAFLTTLVLSLRLKKKHVSRVPNIKFPILPFLDLVTLTLNVLTEGLGSYSEVSQTRSM